MNYSVTIVKLVKNGVWILFCKSEERKDPGNLKGCAVLKKKKKPATILFNMEVV